MEPELIKAVIKSHLHSEIIILANRSIGGDGGFLLMFIIQHSGLNVILSFTG